MTTIKYIVYAFMLLALTLLATACSTEDYSVDDHNAYMCEHNPNYQIISYMEGGRIYVSGYKACDPSQTFTATLLRANCYSSMNAQMIFEWVFNNGDRESISLSAFTNDTYSPCWDLVIN